MEKGRLLSLDAFRGLTIAGMIVVNSSGNDHGYAWLDHAPWHGWTPADLVFPSFLVIMGVSLAISLGRRLERGESQAHVLRLALRRSLIIFSLGLIVTFIQPHPAAGLRVLGVLQRIAACDLACALLYVGAGPALQAGAAVLLLGGYWLALTHLRVPGLSLGDLSPEGSVAAYVDRWFLAGHLYDARYDPEGLLSTLPAIATALLGVLAGAWLRSRRRRDTIALGLLIAGGALWGAGWLWSGTFPLNKHLWTSSYALFTGGQALTGLALCYWLIEDMGLSAWAKPFEVLGRNPLLAYFLSGLLYGVMEFIPMTLADGSRGELKLWLCERLFSGLTPPDASLAFALAYAGLCWALMAWLYRRKLFLKV